MSFADGSWTALNPEGTVQCNGGAGTVKQVANDEYPLPPVPHPGVLTGLKGKTVQVYTGDCPATVELTIDLERTGD